MNTYVHIMIIISDICRQQHWIILYRICTQSHYLEQGNYFYIESTHSLNNAGLPRSGPLAELKCKARAAFRHEMKFLRENEDQLRSQSMLSKLQRGEWRFLLMFNAKKESLPPLTVGGTSVESNIANLWKDNFSAIVNSVG